jgi:hypothetical protein
MYGTHQAVSEHHLQRYINLLSRGFQQLDGSIANHKCRHHQEEWPGNVAVGPSAAASVHQARHPALSRSWLAGTDLQR